MKDSTLMKFALIISFVGLVFMYFYSESLVLDYTEISKLKEKGIDDYVKIRGEIIKLTRNTKFITMDIADETGQVNVALFNPGDFNLKKGDQIEVFGKIGEYSGQIQVVASRTVLFTNNL